MIEFQLFAFNAPFFEWNFTPESKKIREYVTYIYFGKILIIIIIIYYNYHHDYTLSVKLFLLPQVTSQLFILST